MSGLRDELARRLEARRVTRGFVRWYSFYRSRVHIISYPKSGRTWLRLALGMLFQEQLGLTPRDPADLLEINRLARIDRRVPSIRFSHDDDPHMKRAAELERSKKAYRSRDVILLVRDPRDVVVSSYHQHTRRTVHSKDPTFKGTMASFVRHPAFGVETVIEFMNIWARNRTVPRSFTLVRYEDMVADLGRELVRVLGAARLEEPHPEVIRRAVEASSFDRMQEAERENALYTARLQPGDPGDPDSFKVRRGRVGGFVDELEAPERAYVNEAMAALDPLFGYNIG